MLSFSLVAEKEPQAWLSLAEGPPERVIPPILTQLSFRPFGKCGRESWQEQVWIVPVSLGRLGLLIPTDFAQGQAIRPISSSFDHQGLLLQDEPSQVCGRRAHG